jgi:hypothetical protein
MSSSRSPSPRPAAWTRLVAALATAVAAAVPAAGCATDPASVAPAQLAAPPHLTYFSAFMQRVDRSDAPPIDWSQSNALMGRLQGHVGHLRGDATATPATTAPHGGAHDGHGTSQRQP